LPPLLVEPLDLLEAWLARADGFFALADFGFGFVELARAFDLPFFEAVLVSAMDLSSCGWVPSQPIKFPDLVIQNEMRNQRSLARLPAARRGNAERRIADHSPWLALGPSAAACGSRASIRGFARVVKVIHVPSRKGRR
jgi:hypothetical protein